MDAHNGNSVKIIHAPILMSAALVLALFLVASPVRAQTATVELASCTPNVSVGKDNTFTTKRGDVVTFSCLIKNKGETPATVLLNGARSKGSGANSILDTSVTIAIDVPAGGEKETDLPFLALFENGTYRYELTLKNASDGASFGRTISYSGVLNGLVAKIKSATLDRNSYAEGQPMTLTLSTLLPGGAPAGSFLLDVVAKDKDGNVCAYGITSKPITTAEESDTFALPGSTVCEAAAIGVIVKTGDGFPTDTRDIPLTAPATSMDGSNPASSGRSNGALAALLGVLVIAATGAVYELWKHRRGGTSLQTNV